MNIEITKNIESTIQEKKQLDSVQMINYLHQFIDILKIILSQTLILKILILYVVFYFISIIKFSSHSINAHRLLSRFKKTGKK